MESDPQALIVKLSRELELVKERERLLMEIDAVTHVLTDPAEITYNAARLLGLPTAQGGTIVG